MPSDSSDSDHYEFKIGGVHISTSIAKEVWMINYFFNQDIIQKPSIVGLTTYEYKRWIPYLRLCTGNRCLIIVIHRIIDIPSSLQEFCVDEQICFVGVNMKDTLAALEKQYGLKFGTNNWKDLGELEAAITDTTISTSVCDEEEEEEEAEEEEEKPNDQLVQLARNYGGGLNLERTTRFKNYSTWRSPPYEMRPMRTTEQIYYATLDTYAAYLIGKELL